MKLLLKLGSRTVVGIVAGSGIAMTTHSGELTSAADVLACAAANGPDKNLALQATFITTTADGNTREMGGRILSRRSDRALTLNIRVTGPEDMADTVVLIKEQEGNDILRIYLPSVGRTKAVSGEMASQNLLGTHFSYQDFKNIFGAFESGSSELVGVAEAGERAAYHLRVTPENPSLMDYALMEVMIDRATCTPLSVDFLDGEGKVTKRLSAEVDSIASVAGDDSKKIAQQYTLTDLSDEGQTMVTLSDLVFDERITRDAFSPVRFQNAK